MAVRHGYGKIAGADALVFAYDTGDTRNSYRGEPTTNLALNPTFSSTTNWSLASNGGGSFSTANNIGKITAGSAGSYSYLYQTVNTTVASNESLTWSVEFKNNVVGGFAIRIVLFLNGTVKTQPVAYVSLDGTGGTVRKSVTTSHADGANSVRIDVLQGSYYSGLTDTDAEFFNAQLERNSHATPFTAGTRSATQGLLDLTGRNTVDLTNASYNSSAQVDFDGTTDLITVTGYKLSTTDGTQPYTIEAVIKRGGGSSAGGIITQYRTSVDAPDRFGFREMSPGYLSWWKGGNIAIGSSIMPTGVYLHIVGTKAADGSVTVYQNGEVIATGTDTRVFEDEDIQIGAFGSGIAHFDGEIPVTKIYNRALTANEVRNNYNQYKGRFNI